MKGARRARLAAVFLFHVVVFSAAATDKLLAFGEIPPSGAGFMLAREGAAIMNHATKESHHAVVFIEDGRRSDLRAFSVKVNNDVAVGHPVGQIFANCSLLSNIHNGSGHERVVFFHQGGNWGPSSIVDNEAYMRHLNDCRHLSVVSDDIFDKPFFSFIVKSEAVNSENENIWSLQQSKTIFGGFGLSGRGIGGFLRSAGSADIGVGSAPNFGIAFPHVKALVGKCDQLQNKNEQLEPANQSLISRDFLITRSFTFRRNSLLLGGALLFGGGYNIYRERLVWGSALIGTGALLGFWSFLSGGLMSR